ncbi:ectonucleoside triphosphate diphosphohydrolase 7-like isoform X2 [Ruditapes philippinarum]|uniref:ectonucleoside triphosphate diphosphohydrolase 7-like isoform X2 n=1 Tax=Ruditapes philippinarum TaxID=129788 RepID=UPI00295B043F|nr:ectonucleoside triphosphate diphosphohydrolase 7-like isoform X2 [Ruditapes philippinarum]
MARIYLRLPQCSNLKDMMTLKQWMVLSCSVFFIIILVILFIHSFYLDDSDVSSSTQHFLPTGNYKAGKTFFNYGPDVHYGIVLDCGSSGTRVYVYVWPPHSGNPKDLLNIQQLKDSHNQPVVKKISPGLDTFENHPEDASEYLQPLLEFASSHIPKKQHKETLLYILATAGMRLLPEDSQKAILQDLQKDIPKQFDFIVAENNFEVITGKQEGVYAWIAANYVLQKFSHGDDDHPLVAVDIPGENGQVRQHVRRRTVGMIDMGGGSMQIAYELTANIDSVPKHLIAEFNLGCLNSDVDHTYRVYVTTFLGYGANEARDRYEEMLVSKIKQNANVRLKRAAVYNDDVRRSQVTIRPSLGKHEIIAQQLFNKSLEHVVKSSERRDQLPVKSQPAQQVLPPALDPYQNIPDPCLQPGLVLTSKDISIDGKKVTFSGTGDYHRCQEALMPLLNLSQACNMAPCSMNGVHQPKISFSNSEFYGFAELWYTMEDVFRIGGQYEHDVFDAQATDFCEKRWSLLQDRYSKGLYKKAAEHRFRMQCFKSAWMTTVLHKGLKFPKTYRNLVSVQYVNNRDVQWTLGALIHRTRYLPLREIEGYGMSDFKPSWLSSSHIIYNEYLLLVCFAVVAMAICIYVRRLKLCSPKLPISDMSRVPSMSYFMTEMDQVEQGVRLMNNYNYP